METATSSSVENTTTRVYTKHQSKPYRFLQNENRTLKMRMHSPKVDLREKNNKYIIRMELPGTTSDLNVSVKDNQFVLVSGNRQQQQMDTETTVIYSETKYGEFTRRVKLPSVVDVQNYTSYFENGVLWLTFQKVNVESE